MANLGGQLINVYETFIIQAAMPRSCRPSSSRSIQFKGSSVLVGVNDGGSDFTAFKTSLTTWACRSSTPATAYGLDDGYMPINAVAGGRRDAADA